LPRFGSGVGGIYDDLAELYDEVRPGYPSALVDDVLALSGIPESGSILEVGCGTGQATRLFAPRGHRITCVEPGPNLAARAARNCAAFPHVGIECVSFEDWPLREAAFDLVISAQAFHWVDPALSYAKAGRALRTSGALALFWNRPTGTDRTLRDALDAVYRRHAPRLVARLERPAAMDGVPEAIEVTGLFGEVCVKRYPWTDRRSSADYVKLLLTHSDHASLPDETRRILCDEVRAIVDRFGGEIGVEHTAVLYAARRRTD
jgi:SAM-dependent methyltransferase